MTRLRNVRLSAARRALHEAVAELRRREPYPYSDRVRAVYEAFDAVEAACPFRSKIRK